MRLTRIADQLLRWASEFGAGSWAQWATAVDEVWGAAGPSARMAAMTAMSQSGHVEMDWTETRWAVSRPVLATAPLSGAMGFLCGSRHADLMARLARIEEGADDAPTAWVEIHEPTREILPSTIYVQSDSFSALRDIASFLGVTFVHEPAAGLARVLPALQELVLDSPVALPVPESRITRFHPRLQRWDSSPTVAQPGLYRFKPAIGRTQFRYKDERGVLRNVDRAIGMYAALRDEGIRVMSWERDGANGRMAVRAEAYLPDVHARVGVLCSGLVSKEWIHDGAKSQIFQNVPLDVYRAIATSLGQPLREL